VGKGIVNEGGGRDDVRGDNVLWLWTRWAAKRWGRVEVRRISELLRNGCMAAGSGRDSRQL
jgi:hypothetical protein